MIKDDRSHQLQNSKYLSSLDQRERLPAFAMVEDQIRQRDGQTFERHISDKRD
jgi:hypothetical protein